jgi:hypothetical protein
VTYRPADGVLSEDVDGIVILINAAGDELLDLNETGSVVWRAMGDGADLDALVAAVQAAFPDAPADALAADVAAFLAELGEAGLVVG